MDIIQTIDSLKQRVQEIIDSQTVGEDDVKGLITNLKGELEFGLARKVLQVAKARYPNNIFFHQQLALCIYKDEELPPDKRFTRALEILEAIGLRDPENTDPETLSLGGAVYKRKWEFNGQTESLYEALFFYREAFLRNPKKDMGYGGVNAVFILQILANRARIIAKRTGAVYFSETEDLLKQADDLREKVAAAFFALAKENPELEKEYWYMVTAAEIEFGRKNFQKAGEWLAKARQQSESPDMSFKSREWKLATTFRQLVIIARLLGYQAPRENTPHNNWEAPWQALYQLLGEDTEVALSCYRGKTGLALSGGGFRASFYHLGALACMAELDVLRYIEVLSTVSGGSIVGAHYYLEVQNLLKTKYDQDITRQDYIDIVKRVQQDFLKGVQQNVRTRALSSFIHNLKMLFSKTYTRSHRIGELYEEKIYAKVKQEKQDGPSRTMPQLIIMPKGIKQEQGFKPKFSNWRRRAKVPVLLLNTTSLNSGHNWHFTATCMGEPPGTVGTEVDRNERYRRLYYYQAPQEDLKNYRLGYAVAASACVPGIFEPLMIEGLYKDKIIRLVDGGVYDNQGVQGLLDEGCTLILVSDASGQMKNKDNPSNSIVGVPLRSNSILMDRVREAEYQDIKSRVDNQVLEGLFFIHLKKDMPMKTVDWINCQDPTQENDASSLTPYGIDEDIQSLLANIRTDLDSFTEVEAYALMLSGYQMADAEFKALQEEHEKLGKPDTWGRFDIYLDKEKDENNRVKDWPFQQLLPIAEQPRSSNDPRRKELERQLQASSKLFLKPWLLSKPLSVTGIAVLGLLIALLGTWLFRSWNNLVFESLTVGGLVVFAALLLASLIFPFIRLLTPERAIRGYAVKISIAFFGSIFLKLHLHIFDKIFLRTGKLGRLLNKK